MTLKKVISGGQTGVDQIGLKCALDNGIKTGGYISKFFMTEDGNMPHLGELYNIIEIDSTNYPDRTKMNVTMSDGTVLFGNMSSAGSKLTINCAHQIHKSYICNPTDDQLIKFIEDNKIEILNVAGNRKSKLTPSMEYDIKSVLNSTFRKLSELKTKYTLVCHSV